MEKISILINDKFQKQYQYRLMLVLRHLPKLRQINVKALQSLQKVSIVLINLEQRCVQQFDHHCMWINNCIGSKNYKQFLAMIGLTFLNMIAYIISMILLWTQGNFNDYIGSMIAVWVFSLIIAILALLLINLIILHIYLIYRGITTYQFIMLQRQQQQQKKAEEQQKAQSIKMARLRENTMGPIKSKQNKQGQQKLSDEGRPNLVNDAIFKDQSNLKSHENSDVIFGGQMGYNENKTQKSEQMQEQQMKRSNKKMKISLQEGQVKEQMEEPSPLSSKRQNQASLSHFFTKNKSLKFFIGDEIGSRPKSSRNNDKFHTAQQLYNSLKVVKKQVINSNAVAHTSQIKVVQKEEEQKKKYIKSFKELNFEDKN